MYIKTDVTIGTGSRNIRSESEHETLELIVPFEIGFVALYMTDFKSKLAQLGLKEDDAVAHAFYPAQHYTADLITDVLGTDDWVYGTDATKLDAQPEFKLVSLEKY